MSLPCIVSHHVDEIGHGGVSLLAQVSEESGKTLRGRLCRHLVDVDGRAVQGKHVHALGRGQLQVPYVSLVPYVCLATDLLHLRGCLLN